MNDVNLLGMMDSFAETVAAKLYEKLQKEGGAKAPSRRLVSIPEDAEYIGRTVPAVRSLVSIRQLPSFQGNRRTFLDLQDLNVWIIANEN